MQREAVTAAATVLVGAALNVVPAWLRAGTWFGVRVEEGYRTSEAALGTLRRYRAVVMVATLASLAMGLVAQALVLPAMLVQLAAAVWAFRRGWRETRPHAAPLPTERTAYLLGARHRIPGGAAAVAGPMALLGATAVYLRMHWESIPAQFPVHWGLDGRANGWSHRTVGGVLGPLMIGAAILAMLGGMALVVARSARPAPETSSVWRRTRAGLWVMVGAMWVTAVETSLAALLPIVGGGASKWWMVVMVGLPIASVVAGIAVMARAAAGPDDTTPDLTPDACWKWGMFYYNSGDPSLMVEKRFGIGYTLNFALWQSWAILAAVLVVQLVITLLVPKH
jgi:uncharacterized membrane protein